MTNLVCPLCGRRVNLKSFDPTGYDLDITAVEVTGLGRGKGFKEVSNSSILVPGDPTVELIKNRILDLSKMLLDSKCLKPEEVLQVLPYKVDLEEIEEKDKIIGDLSREAISLKSQINNRDRSLREKDSIIGDLTSKNIELNRKANAFKQRMVEKNQVAGDLTEENINLTRRVEELKGKLDHRTEQARKLFWIVKSQKAKIESRNEQIEDLIEELI